MTNPEKSHGDSLPIPRPLRWSEDGEAILMLDQTLLPAEERVLRLESVEAVAEAVSSLRVRGAPAIGIAAAMGLAVGLLQLRRADPEITEAGLADAFHGYLGTLMETRPTAVNLAWALERVGRAFQGAASEGVNALIDAVVREAREIAVEDEAMCRRIGEHGLEVFPQEGAGVLTHCNAGALATAGIGTALAPVYTAHSRGIDVRVVASETRPLLQGARLTAWELKRAGIPVTVISDSMAGAIMRQGAVNLVLVGADRVAANGDVANKIGTYSLAILAHHHGIPFFVALPRSTFDLAVPTGASIPIEERDPSEVTSVAGRPSAPAGVSAWNPAFDVTPAHLITAFICDEGVLRPPFEVSISSLGARPPLGSHRRKPSSEEGK
ncbi:S-methyl-5-thioribose-1-phosphate isomerase [Gemmatimonadota bacterium]